MGQGKPPEFRNQNGSVKNVFIHFMELFKLCQDTMEGDVSILTQYGEGDRIFEDRCQVYLRIFGDQIYFKLIAHGKSLGSLEPHHAECVCRQSRRYKIEFFLM